MVSVGRSVTGLSMATYEDWLPVTVVTPRGSICCSGASESLF